MTPRAHACIAAGLLAGGLTTVAALAPASARGDEAGSVDRSDAGRVEVFGTARRSDPPRVVTPELIEVALVAQAEAAERHMRAHPRASRDGGHRPFIRPAAGALTGWFGERRGGRAHLGMDIDGETGDSIVAAGPGTVVHAGSAPPGYGGYGLTVIIAHGEGVETVYAHLSRVDGAVGQQLSAGDLIGAMGTTGSTTGSHLHFEVRVDGVLVDPADWLST